MKTVKQLLVFAIISFFSINLNAQNDAFKVRIVGEGQPLFFFPGFACTDKVWEEQVAELSKEYECHLFTFAGFGDVAPIEFPWYPKIEEQLLTYIEENKLEEAKVIGHSLGGTLALSLASKKHIFQKIIVVDALTASGALMVPNYNSEDMIYDSPNNNQVLAMTDEDFSKMAIGMANGMTQKKEKQAQIIEWMEKADRKTYVYGYTDYLKVDLRDAVSKIEIPVTILAATQPFGEQMARQTYQKQYENLSDYKLRFAEGAAHFIMYDQPEWLLNEVKSSL